MIYTFLLSIFMASCFNHDAGKNTAFKPVVTAAMLKEWVSYLASDEMRGRKNGSPEMKTAALWIGEKFREAGLKPVNNNNGEFIHDYTFVSRQGAVNEKNVIGYLEGSDPDLKNEYIILSAHFDHIGVRKGIAADSIYNGADDNAAGTCTVIGIAKAIKDAGLKPGRSIIFAAFSGEEQGMRGSRNFVSNPPFPLSNFYANLNFEMTGHSEFLGKRKYYMTGCSKSNLDDLIKEYNRKTSFELIDTIEIAESLFNFSDNISFSAISMADGIRTGIPSGTFATTTHSEYIHNVTDEDDLFDYENMSELVNYFSDVVIWLSNNKTKLNWTDPTFKRP
jgi:Zn-dependent M28 family amino/carboxypeptidase